MTKKEYKKQVSERINRIMNELKNMAKAKTKFDYDNACIATLDRLNDFTEFLDEFQKRS